MRRRNENFKPSDILVVSPKVSDKGWGRAVLGECRKLGMRTEMFDSASNYWSITHRFENLRHSPEDYAFVRVPQEGPEHRTTKQLMVGITSRASIAPTVIPPLGIISEYENKFMQAWNYHNWEHFADTIAISALGVTDRTYGQSSTIRRERDDFISHVVMKFGLPIISKSAYGSASRFVRLLKTVDDLVEEYDTVMSGPGLTHNNLGHEKTQKGYLIWQRFYDSNEYDYRSVRIGNHFMLLKRFNRPDAPFASGSGLVEPVTELTEETAAVLDAASLHPAKFVGMDWVYDHVKDQWVFVETTLAWTQKAYSDCRFFDASGNATKWTGKFQFALIAKEILDGSFL